MEVRLRARPGFTMVEIVVALVLLAGVGLTLSAATGRLTSASGRDAQALVALDLVNDRLARAQADPSYPDLTSRYTETSSTIAGHPGLRRTTQVTRQIENLAGGRQRDVTLVRVLITGPGIRTPVERSVSVAAP